ncbi:MAG: hypothetical protein Q4C79_11630 [Neisseria sp.]|uniref:hypothetical protein n=1 Tax=Neisseria sp. TaxID=192066 RepID=UPI0026DCDE53|nr:hypothetical protein [Neisseria sp.]MDO4249582.1 hypothetical protein [Neisseria sp.]
MKQYLNSILPKTNACLKTFFRQALFFMKRVVDTQVNSVKSPRSPIAAAHTKTTVSERGIGIARFGIRLLCDYAQRLQTSGFKNA